MSARPVGLWRALGRGARLRCARCGGGGLFTSWFRMKPSCPTCALPFEREDGSFLGSITLNYSVTGLVGIAYMIVAFAVYRGAPVWTLTLVGMLVIAPVPALFYPFSKTLWVALDFVAFRREYDPPTT